MKKLLQYILTIIFIAAVILTGVNVLLEYSIKKQNEDIFGKLQEIFSGNENYDALFLGSSRVLVHINPSIMDSVLHVNSYNLGLDAMSVVEFNFIVNAWLEKHPAPKLLVMNLDRKTLLVNDTTEIFDYPLYFPYLKNKSVSAALNEFEPDVPVLSFMPFLKPAYYDDFKKYVAVKALFHIRHPEKILYKGFEPTYLEWGGEEIRMRDRAAWSPKGRELLKNILDLCRQKNIVPVLVLAPQTKEFTRSIENFDEYKAHLRSFSESNGVYFFDYSGLITGQNKKYFYNHSHLKPEGAGIYSLQLADDLKKVLRKD